MPDAEFDWDLSGKQVNAKKESGLALVVCSGCRAYFRSTLTKCPNCGCEKIIIPRHITETEAEIGEIDQAYIQDYHKILRKRREQELEEKRKKEARSKAFGILWKMVSHAEMVDKAYELGLSRSEAQTIASQVFYKKSHYLMADDRVRRSIMADMARKTTAHERINIGIMRGLSKKHSTKLMARLQALPAHAILPE